MLAHDKHGYPADFVSNSEPNTRLQKIALPRNDEVGEEEFQRMIARASLPEKDKRLLAEQSSGLGLARVQQQVYDSYWGVGQDCQSNSAIGFFHAMMGFQTEDLRRLLHPEVSRVQGRHPAE